MKISQFEVWVSPKVPVIEMKVPMLHIMDDKETGYHVFGCHVHDDDLPWSVYEENITEVLRYVQFDADSFVRITTTFARESNSSRMTLPHYGDYIDIVTPMPSEHATFRLGPDVRLPLNAAATCVTPLVKGIPPCIPYLYSPVHDLVIYTSDGELPQEVTAHYYLLQPKKRAAWFSETDKVKKVASTDQLGFFKSFPVLDKPVV